MNTASFYGRRRKFRVRNMPSDSEVLSESDDEPEAAIDLKVEQYFDEKDSEDEGIFF